MSELTGRAKNRANGAQASAAAGAEAAPEPAEEAGLPGMTATEMPGDPAVVRRTKDGWRVGDADVPDLTSAMVLADLISAELAAPGTLAEQPAAASTATASNATAANTTAANTTAANTTLASNSASSDTAGSDTAGNAAVTAAPEESAGQATAPGHATAATTRAAAPRGSSSRAGKAKAKGKSKDPAASETSRLRTTVGQLEHALTARIRVEQAIGVLAERHRIQPRQAFEQLRTAARNRGRRVIDIASDVVASATNPLLQLPDELSRPRATGRQGRRTRQTPGVLSSE